jgi:toxin FitB
LKIVDSVGWLEYLGRGPLAEKYDIYLEDPKSLLTPTIILYEVHKYVLRNRGPEAAEDASSMILESRIIPLSDGLAVFAAQQSSDNKLPMADAIIYATALTYGATVVTSDSHFEGLPQVEFIPRPVAGD